MDSAAAEPSIVTSSEITPPSNLKFEPVICPLDFNVSPLALISFDVILKPPIAPAVAVIVPAIVTLPSGCR